MTVDSVDGDEAFCVRFDKSKREKATFNVATLQKYEGEGVG